VVADKTVKNFRGLLFLPHLVDVMGAHSLTVVINTIQSKAKTGGRHALIRLVLNYTGK